VKEPQNFLVPVGTNHRELIEAAGGFVAEPEKIISGGPMMGMAMNSLDVPVTKTSSSLLCFQKDPLNGLYQTNCINCGRCVQVCPGRVLPSRLAKFATRGDMESFLRYDGLECCECGCCSYVCPAKRHLVQTNKLAKAVLRDYLNKQKAEKEGAK
jgi:electron transport complex protein RnfC